MAAGRPTSAARSGTPVLVVEARDAAFGYAGRAVVRAPALDVVAGRCLGLFGPNGSGKTTLVRGLAGLLAPIAGTVRRDPAVRFGYVPQHRGVDLLWPMSGFDVASMAVSARRRLGWLTADDRRRVRAAMTRLDASAFDRRSFATLSGGQQQRLLLAAALAAGPDVLILDEPTDGLDVRSRDALLGLLRELVADGLGVVLISHDVADLRAACDRVAWLHAADAPGEPSAVETIDVDAFATRLFARESR